VIFSWGYVIEIAPLMLHAATTTFVMTILSMAAAATIGLFVAAARASRHRAVASLGWGYVEVLRSVPLLIQIYFLFFVFPEFGLTLDAFVVGVVGLGIYYSTFVAEVYRAGLEAVPRGQREAATALNMGGLRALRSVILPQAIPPMVPPLGNYLIEMFKATPILATIGLHELLGQGEQLAADTFRYAEVFFLIAVVFLGLSYPSSLFIRWLEAHVSLGRQVARAIAEAEATVV